MRPPLIALTVQAMWVHVASKALMSPAVGWVTMKWPSGKYIPPPTGMSATLIPLPVVGAPPVVVSPPGRDATAGGLVDAAPLGSSAPQAAINPAAPTAPAPRSTTRRVVPSTCRSVID